MASNRSQLMDDLQFQVLRLLEERPDTSERELAQRLGVSNGKLHYCMKALVDKGLVKPGTFAHSRNRLGYVYLLTAAGVRQKAAMAASFLTRKMAEYEALQAEIAALKAEMGSSRRNTPRSGATAGR